MDGVPLSITIDAFRNKYWSGRKRPTRKQVRTWIEDGVLDGYSIGADWFVLDDRADDFFERLCEYTRSGEASKRKGSRQERATVAMAALRKMKIIS